MVSKIQNSENILKLRKKGLLFRQACMSACSLLNLNFYILYCIAELRIHDACMK